MFSHAERILINMGTTTIRVDTETHARLIELSESTGSSLMATVRAAAEALRRQRFARQVAAEQIRTPGGSRTRRTAR